jgi:hypothetical protein
MEKPGSQQPNNPTPTRGEPVRFPTYRKIAISLLCSVCVDRPTDVAGADLFFLDDGVALAAELVQRRPVERRDLPAAAADNIDLLQLASRVGNAFAPHAEHAGYQVWVKVNWLHDRRSRDSSKPATQRAGATRAAERALYEGSRRSLDCRPPRQLWLREEPAV